MNKSAIQTIEHRRSRIFLENIQMTNPEVSKEIALEALANMLAGSKKDIVSLDREHFIDLTKKLFDVFADDYDEVTEVPELAGTKEVLAALDDLTIR